MSTRNTNPQTQGKIRPAVTRVQGPKSKAQSPGTIQRSGLEIYRLMAAAALVLVLVGSLLAPISAAVPDTSPLVTPRIDGSGAVPAFLSGDEIEQSLFRYQSVIERNQGGSTSVPDRITDILRYDPNSVSVRRTIIGQIIASSSGNLNQALVDTGFFANLDLDKLQGIEEVYQGFANNETRKARGLNGLAAMQLVRSLGATGDERKSLEQDAFSLFQQALETESQTWQFTYNWSLCNLLMGNYAAAYDGMRGISSKASADNDFLGIGNKLTLFWMGLTALRGGDPGEALIRFTDAANSQPPQKANEELQKLYGQVRGLGREGLGDAQWANRDPAAAYKTYYETLSLGDTDDTGLYSKWLRLGLQQHAYEKLLDDMASLSTSTAFGKDARLHHDRARLLTFLGRASEADGEYRRALDLGENDPSLRISYGEALESGGDHNGALAQAEAAIRGLGKDPTSSDLSSVARSVVTTTASIADAYAAQQLLDANLLRAHAWGKLNQKANVEALVSGITQQASSLPQNQAGLLELYGGLAAEAGGWFEGANIVYGQAWGELFKDLPAGTPGRSASLSGLARTAGATKGAAQGVQVLVDNGYDPANIKNSVIKDPDAPIILQQGALLLDEQGQKAQAANALRVASILGNIGDARKLTGVGRPIWYNNGTLVPAETALAAADAARLAGSSDPGLTVLRYREVFSLDPALAPAWNNLGVLYAQVGKQELADSYLSLAGKVSPDYTWGQHNRAALDYKRGVGSFFSAEAAQGAAIKSAGPQSLSWGYNLRPDDRGPLPAPSGPAPDLWSRLPAVLILILLLAHTLVGNDRRDRAGLVPTKGMLGRLAAPVDRVARQIAPGLVVPGNSRNALLATIGIPSIVGMLALAWAAGRGSWEVALVFLPAALVVSLLAFGANELAQYWAARLSGSATLHHVWPFGVLLGVLSIPFNFVYGWQAVTRIQPASGDADGERARHARTGEDLELAYEAQAEAAAELEETDVALKTTPAALAIPGPRSLFGLSRVARIMFAGLAANLALGLIFGLVYWLTGWPSMRLGMYAAMLVLVFTGVSEPPADGWTLYRRNARLWLVVFVVAALAVTLLAAGWI